MATIIKQLIATLSLDNSQYKKGMKESKGEAKGLQENLSDAGKKGGQGLDEVGKKSQKLGGDLKGLGSIIGGVFAAGTVIEFAKRVVSVTAEFQKMEAVLATTLGDKSLAKSAMQSIVDFASKTPFQVNELTDSFVKLANRGFVPNQKELTKLGDLASSTGKSFDQLTEAALDAMTGEFERLKEFGIKASSEGNKVQFTFKGVTTEVEKTDSAIKDYILSLGDAEGVTGSMAAISETVGGKLSNLDDNFTQLFKSIGDSSSGLISGVLNLANAMTSHLVESMNDVNTVASKTGAGGLKSFFMQISSILNPAYAAQLKAQAGLFKAIDNQAYEAAMELKRAEDEKTAAQQKGNEEAKKRAEEQIKFYNASIKLSDQYNEKLLAELGTTNLQVESLKKLNQVSEQMAKKIIPKQIIDVGMNLSEPPVSEYDLELIKQADEEAKKYNKSLNQINEVGFMIGKTLQGAFEDIFRTGEFSFRGLIQMLGALIVKLAAAAAAALVLSILVNTITFGSSGAAAAKSTASFSSLFSMLSGLPKFAEGGMVTGMTTAVLGDNTSGKEAIIPFEKMGSFLNQFGGGGNMRVEVVGRLEGETIYFSGVNYLNGRNKTIS